MIKKFTSEKYGETIRSYIKDEETVNNPGYYGGAYTTATDSGTGHVSVLAPDGSAVSVTSTISRL